MSLLNSISTQCIYSGVDATIKFSVVLLVASVICFLLRRQSAAIRNRIWSLALLSGLVIPAGTCFLPQFAIPVFPAIQTTPATNETLTLERALVPFVESDVVQQNTLEHIALSKESKDFDSGSRIEAKDASALTGFTGSVGITMAWLVGSIYFLTRLLVGCWQCRKLVQSAEVATGELSNLVNATASALNLRFPVMTLVSNEVAIPLAIGIVRLTVIMPNDSKQWSRNSQRFAIMHELVHHERRDVAWQILAQTVSAIYWFHPLVWYATYRMRLEREFACDDRVVQIANEATDYAQQLVEIARHASHAQFASAVAMAQPSGLEQRIVAIFDNARSHLPLSKPSAFRLALGMLVCMIALSVAKPVARAVQLDEKAKQPESTAVAEGNSDTKQTMAVDHETRFLEAINLLKSGDHVRAEVILSELAPSARAGYAPAHRMRARIFADQLQNSSNESILNALRWHLEHSGNEPNVAIERFWSAYYVKLGKPEEAISHMELATKMEPRLLITLANLYKIANNKSGQLRTLRAAESHFQQHLQDNPLAREDRLQLVMALTKLDKPNEAEEVMLMGVKLHDDAEIRRSAAEFYVLRYQAAENSDPKDLALQLGYLEKALEQDVFYQDTYEKMILFFQRAQNTGEANRIEKTLEQMLVGGQSPSLVHFTLSGIYQIIGEKDRSESHLFQSYRLDGKFPLMTNNLAWLLAHQEQPGLTRAHELALNAVRAMPKDPRFRDTLATILMLQGKTYEAIAEFEAIIGVALDKQKVHRNLATLYRKIGDETMAERHETKADELEKWNAEELKRRANQAK